MNGTEPVTRVWSMRVAGVPISRDEYTEAVSYCETVGCTHPIDVALVALGLHRRNTHQVEQEVAA